MISFNKYFYIQCLVITGISLSRCVTYSIENVKENITYFIEEDDRNENNSFFKDINDNIGTNETELRENLHHKPTELPQTTEFSTPDINEDLCNYNDFCLIKCCPLNQMYVNYTCVNRSLHLTEEWSVHSYDNDLNNQNASFMVRFPPNPNPKANCIVHDKSEFKVLKNGKISFKLWEHVIEHDFYCLDTGFSDEDGQLQHFGALCYEPRQISEFSKLTRQIQVAGQIVSCVCLAIILALYFPVSKKLSLQDKSFICLCLSLFLGFVILAINMTPSIINVISHSWCLFVAFTSQYFLLSFYSWLAVRCYDIFRTIKGTVQSVPLDQMNSSRNRFTKYCCISYGIPFIFTASTAIAEHLPESYLPQEIRPNIGNGRCWIEEKVWALGLYYYGYQILLHILNVVFMGMSSFLLYKEGAAFTCCKRNTSVVHLTVHNKPNLQLFWQQFFIFMFCVTLLGFDSVSLIYPKEQFWRVFDILNSLQGLFLLIIVMKYSPKGARLQHINFATAKKRAMSFSSQLRRKVSSNPFNPSSVRSTDTR